jgi:hypothetical protein
LISLAALEELSPPDLIPRDDPEFDGLYRFRWETWRLLRAAGSIDPLWEKSTLDGLFGSHRLSWRVIGFTKSAIELLRGPDGDFRGKREPGRLIRSHLYPRRVAVEDLRRLPLDTSLEDFIRITWPKDVTLIGLKREDRLLEGEEYFRSEGITWDNSRGSLFPEAGKGWKYGERERQFLRDLTLKA